MNPANAFTIRRLAAVQAAIADTPLDFKSIAAATFTSRPYISKLMPILRREKRVHIAGWVLCRNNWAALYKWGEGRDKRRPKPQTGTEGQRVYRERIRKDPEANDFFLARQRAIYRANRAAKRPVTWLSALGAP